MQQSFLLPPPRQQQQMTPEEKRKAIAQHFQQQIMGGSAQNPEQGIGQLAQGIGAGINGWMSKPQNQFPTAPNADGFANPNGIGVQGSLLGGLGNLFNFGKGLY